MSKSLDLPLKGFKSTQLQSLTWTSFFFSHCLESEISFPAANNYSVPVHKDVNPCCSPFRFVFKNSLRTSVENLPFSLYLEFPGPVVQTSASIRLSYSSLLILFFPDLEELNSSQKNLTIYLPFIFFCPQSLAVLPSYHNTGSVCSQFP